MAQHTGKVVWFDSLKGYGFLRTSGRRDVFVHISAVQSEGSRALEEEQDVAFDIKEGRTGRDQAANVRVLPQPATVL